MVRAQRVFIDDDGILADGFELDVPWRDLDLSNPARPRLMCSVEDLATLT